MRFEYFIITKNLDLQEENTLGGNQAMTAAKAVRAPVRMTV